MASRSVSLVCTVLNEAVTIDELLGSIAAQTRQPDEVVVVDGGSTDGTWELLNEGRERLHLRALRRVGINISAGRNAAIRAASGEVIATTDAGVRLDPHWLEALVRPFERADPPDVVGGFFSPDPKSFFELVLGATTLPNADEIEPERFLPSSRSVAFTRHAWESVGGYPEWLDYCEDLVFDFALKARGCRFWWAPEAITYFRPRSTPWKFFLQYYRYGRGDGKAQLWSQRHLVRYITYLGAAALLRLKRGHALFMALLLSGGIAYCSRPARRLWPKLGESGPSERLLGLALIPGIRLIGDTAKMLGYPAGLIWRFRRGAALGR